MNVVYIYIIYFSLMENDISYFKHSIDDHEGKSVHRYKYYIQNGKLDRHHYGFTIIGELSPPSLTVVENILRMFCFFKRLFTTGRGLGVIHLELG